MTAGDRYERITADPQVYPNQPTIKGTRVRVADILTALAQGRSFDAVRAAYPELTDDDISAAVAYSAGEIERNPPPAAIQQPYTLADLRRHRDAILALAAEHKATDVRVFGSVARGDARPGSDVDLLVRFADNASLIDQAGLVQSLRDLVGTEIDVVSENGLRSAMRDDVLSEAVAL